MQIKGDSEVGLERHHILQILITKYNYVNKL